MSEGSPLTQRIAAMLDDLEEMLDDLEERVAVCDMAIRAESIAQSMDLPCR